MKARGYVAGLSAPVLTCLFLHYMLSKFLSKKTTVLSAGAKCAELPIVFSIAITPRGCETRAGRRRWTPTSTSSPGAACHYEGNANGAGQLECDGVPQFQCDIGPQSGDAPLKCLAPNNDDTFVPSVICTIPVAS
ncbi:hypothetical protein F4802DRAFT_583996 [Xylaria palmicola]|nr:hypothetical protein F4802DRAFT_583996 [Xylaria palmicola]